VLNESVAFTGDPDRGRFKNPADGRASLVPIVRTMRPDGKGVEEMPKITD
jgi:hypothetical protein